METRTIEQTKIYVLVMNPMTDSAESQREVAYSFDYQKLVDLLKNDKTEMWADDNFRKSFKKGSVLEWFNPLYNMELDRHDTFGHGIFSHWVNSQNLSRIQIPEIK